MEFVLSAIFVEYPIEAMAQLALTPAPMQAQDRIDQKSTEQPAHSGFLFGL